MRYANSILLLLFCMETAIADNRELFDLVERAEMRETIRNQGDGALLEESTALEQARTKARSRTDYGLELRPSVSDNDAALALRIYLPDQWSKRRLREQLALAAKSEQLRIAALEWEQLILVYRDFCTYRMLQGKLARIEAEQRFVEPILGKADNGVEMNQLATSERARIYSTYLGLLNDRTDVRAKLTETEQRLKGILGPDADLEKLSSIAVIQMPSRLEIKGLLHQALRQRADLQQMVVDYRSFQLAEKDARSDDRFRLKYLQPAYRVDYDNGSTGWELSASIVLPWGFRNPDVAVYQSQQELAMKALSEKQRMTESRLSALLDTANAYYAEEDERNRELIPLKKQMEQDLATMADLPLVYVRDTLSIRSRLLDTDLIGIEIQQRLENIAIDLAEELGSL